MELFGLSLLHAVDDDAKDFGSGSASVYASKSGTAQAGGSARFEIWKKQHPNFMKLDAGP